MNIFETERWQQFLHKLKSELIAHREQQTNKRFIDRWLYIPDGMTRKEAEDSWNRFWENYKERVNHE